MIDAYCESDTLINTNCNVFLKGTYSQHNGDGARLPQYWQPVLQFGVRTKHNFYMKSANLQSRYFDVYKFNCKSRRKIIKIYLFLLIIKRVISQI